MQRVLLQLPVPAYLKKILEVKYGNPYAAKENTLLGMTVINTLKRKSEKDYSYVRQQHPQNFRFRNSNEYFFITVAYGRSVRKGFVIDQKKMMQISRSLDRNIREDLYTSIIVNKEKYGIEYQTTILDFLDLYDISDEELSYESIRKDFNRNRKKIMLKLNLI